MVQRQIRELPGILLATLTIIQIIYFSVFQYCFVRVFMTIVAVITEAAGRYCLASVHPAFAHIWVRS